MLKIWRDSDFESPRTLEDNVGTMVCWHKRYNLGDSHDFKAPSEFESWRLKNKDAIAVCLPLYILDHGILTISLKPFNDPWDSGQVGWIYVTKDKVRKELGVKRITADVLQNVRRYLEGEVKRYDQWLRGDVYGYTLFEAAENNVEVLDSCGGFYGDNPAENGMLEAGLPTEIQKALSQVGSLQDDMVVISDGDVTTAKHVGKLLQEKGLLTKDFLAKFHAVKSLLTA